MSENGVQGLSGLDRRQLAVLVRELLLAGHLIDRASMPHLLGEFGRDGMGQIAIDEWMAASPIYTRRMREALGVTGDGVEDIFKCLQFDIGAPPQFMDFRYAVHSRTSGEFWLDHCGALMDVEPMGDEYVTTMCHDIEDPTFDATAVATNPHAKMRPVHRPPRSPAGPEPHCRWTVTIDENDAPAEFPVQAHGISGSRAASLDLSPIDPADPGRGDYSGPLLADVDFADWSHSALVRMAEEVSLQGHLLVLGCRQALRARTDEETVRDVCRKQFAGVAGVVADRLRRALRLPADLAGVAQVLAIHPALGPRQYVEVQAEPAGGRLSLRIGRTSPACADGAWPALLDAEHIEPLQALARGVCARATVRFDDADDRWLRLLVEETAEELPESPEVQLTRISTGADFAFQQRDLGIPVVPAAGRQSDGVASLRAGP